MAHADAGTACPEASRPWVLAAAILASAMAFIDGSVVTIALPVIQRELGAGLAALQWVVNGYVLFLGALLLVGGAAGDRFGRRRVFLAGTVVFAAASLGCAAAPGVGWLIAARVAQGIGAALMVPQSLAIISAAFPQDIRGRAIGTWAGAAALTTALGPAVGGFLIDSLGWRAAFWLNLPLAALAVALALAHVPESRAPEAGPLDWAGGLLAVLASGLVALGLTTLAGPDAPGWHAWALVLAGVLVAAGFLRVERAAVAPLMPPKLFASRAFTGANLLTLFLYGALAAVLFLLPFELIGRRGLGASQAGLVLLPVGLVIGVFARPVGGIADRLGVRGFLVGGSALVAVAGAWLALGLDGLGLGIVAPMLTLAVGMTLVVAPLTTAVMNAAPDALAGAASGVNNAASRLAGLFAVALVGAVTAVVFGRAGEAAGAVFGTLPEPADPDFAAVAAGFDAAYSAGMATAAGLALLAAITGWLTLGPSRSDFSRTSS
jgi:EmrB/QacA subfamily drug resistance transporter